MITVGPDNCLVSAFFSDVYAQCKPQIRYLCWNNCKLCKNYIRRVIKNLFTKIFVT